MTGREGEEGARGWGGDAGTVSGGTERVVVKVVVVWGVEVLRGWVEK